MISCNLLTAQWCKFSLGCMSSLPHFERVTDLVTGEYLTDFTRLRDGEWALQVQTLSLQCRWVWHNRCTSSVSNGEIVYTRCREDDVELLRDSIVVFIWGKTLRKMWTWPIFRDWSGLVVYELDEVVAWREISALLWIPGACFQCSFPLLSRCGDLISMHRHRGNIITAPAPMRRNTK